MPETDRKRSTEHGVEAFPNDVRHLKDFPLYDSSLLDGPLFRQKLHTWASRTEKVAAALNHLSCAFNEFHSTGLKHYESACSVLSGLQEVASIYESSSSTISSSLSQFSESLNRIWCYYDAFLGQTQMITVEPISKLAKMFTNLKLLYDEVLQYRKEYLLAADQMCACRHISKLTDPHQFSQLAEACYTAQRTYRLVLSKYIVCMREAHTAEMMNFMRRIIEHLLSIYSHHNFSTEVLKDIEPELNILFSNTKDWRSFYLEEQEVWGELQRHVQDHVISDHQDQVQHVHAAASVDGGHAGRLAEVGKQVLKPIMKILPAHSPAGGGKQECRQLGRSESEQWTVIQLPSPGGPSSSTGTITEEHVISMPVNFTELPTPVGGLHRKLRLMRSNSDPDVLLSRRPTEEKLTSEASGTAAEHQLTFELRSVEDGSSSNSMCRSLSHNDLILDDSCQQQDEPTEASLDTAAEKMEEVISLSQPKSRRPLFSMFKHSRRKRVSSVTSSQDDSSADSRRRRKFLGRSRSLGTKKAKENRHKSHRSGIQSASSSIDKEELPNSSSSSSCEQQQQQRPAGAEHAAGAVADSSELNKNVQQLIRYQPASWIMSGYLMLRMKLPNNRYAWSYIYCVVDRELGQLMVQEQSLQEPRELEDLQLCGVKTGTPDFIDRNFCFRVISPTSEHLFQALTESEMMLWIAAIQEGIAEAIKRTDLTSKRQRTTTGAPPQLMKDSTVVVNAMNTILSVPGNTQCADCSGTDVQWASINLGIALCIECSGVHRGLGVHVSKVRSLNLDKWDSATVQFMQAQGNTKTNGYYEARLGKGHYADIKKPSSSSSKNERLQYIQLKYVTLAFVPELADPSPSLS